MKIGILTQPLRSNYGGLLQCYALMLALRRLGHSPEVIQRVPHKWNNSFYGPVFRFACYLASSVKRMQFFPMITQKKIATVEQHTNFFTNKYINPRTPFIYTNSQLRKTTAQVGYDAYIAGSDQCWRPMYSPCITNYFFDFAKGKKCKRLAYAASFGVDTWEFSDRETEVCRELAQHFDVVSVREKSGISLCKDYLGVKAVHVLDPTMLLDAPDYSSIVEAENEPMCNGDLFCYILDKNKEKEEIVHLVSQKLGLVPFRCMPKLPLTPQNASLHLDECVYPSVTKWLRSFMDAKMVITDSFHGCVFSIIFNKPFWVIGNKNRGLARFHSLLSDFGLESRLVNVDRKDEVDWNISIDWNEVNKKRKKLQKLSYDFLNENL